MLALERLAAEDIDLVLLDLVMPRCNGLQVLTAMRERGASRPVIVLSAVTEVSTRVQALDSGAVDFVMKPFHTSELVARVRRHLVQLPTQRTRGRPLPVRGRHPARPRTQAGHRRRGERGPQRARVRDARAPDAAPGQRLPA